MRVVTKKIRSTILYNSNNDLKSHFLFRYQRLLFSRFISRGRKIRAFNMFLDLKFFLKLRENTDPNLVFLISMLKATPVIFLLPVRLGSFTQGVPMPISEKKQITFAVKWVVKVAQNSKRKISIRALADALVDVIYDKGPIFDKKMLTYDTGLKNRHLLRFYK